MKILERYVMALNRRDPDVVASLFDNACVFMDKAPRLLTGKDICAHGREEVRVFFKDLFESYEVSAVMLADMGNRAFYNVSLDRQLLRCVCRVDLNEGLIQEMFIDLR
jgi:hypothetical protein